MGSQRSNPVDTETIRIHGARTHNLRDLDLDLPRNQMVVVTGPSGSGKSSLALDTLHAEGQRQYIESLSTYARQFLHQLQRPDVDLIEGLQPTISVDQRRGIHNPRSTVATVTEIYDYLRLLYARVGEACCYQCGRPVRQQGPEQIVDELCRLPDQTRLMILAPIVRGRRGGHREALATIRKAGFQRVRIDGTTLDIEAVGDLAPEHAHQIEAVIDRIVARASSLNRLAESVRLAIRHGDGLVIASYEEKDDSAGSCWHDRLFSTTHACGHCGISYEEIEPRTFSFNSPYGACPACEGLGRKTRFDRQLVVPDLSLSLAGGALAPWRGSTPSAARKRNALLADFLATHDIQFNTPLERLEPSVLEALIEGEQPADDGRAGDGAGDGNGDGNGDGDGDGVFPGVLAILQRQYDSTSSDKTRRSLETFRSQVPCSPCDGSRLRAEARSVRVGGLVVHELTRLSVAEAGAFFDTLTVEDDDLPVAEPIVTEIAARLEFLRKVGLDYLGLDRPADTLSGGELQRVRLATGLGSGLVGVCYILDEPSIGLHPRDNQRLIEALRGLQSRGNTVLIVEHDEAIMRQSDWLIDLGPGAGRHGGQVVAAGPPEKIVADGRSLTGRYLSGELSIPVSKTRRRVAKTRSITLEGVTTNNLKDVTVRLPLGVFVCVTGVSGSGKSSLLNETFARAVIRRLGGIAPKPGPHASLRGTSKIDKIVPVDQSPIGRTPRSNPATYTGVFDEIRKVFTGTRDARRRGYKAGRFSFNVKGGRCETCQGQGQQRIEMNFLPDLHVTCPDCQGRRFNRQTLAIRYRDRSIADVLAMRVDDAIGFFENFPTISRLLGSLHEVGLGYLTLGQASTTLSGGEAQRVKLATELARVDTGTTLYTFDEPTTGLHFDDIKKLLEVLGRLVDRGNTVIVIEHNLDVLKTADWLIDLGPEGGTAGGYIVAEGTPEQIAAMEDNQTGQHLRNVL